MHILVNSSKFLNEVYIVFATENVQMVFGYGSVSVLAGWMHGVLYSERETVCYFNLSCLRVFAIPQNELIFYRRCEVYILLTSQSNINYILSVD